MSDGLGLSRFFLLRFSALPDGSRLTLDTATAVDVQFTAEYRRIRLRDGRLYIDLAPDPARPLEIATDEPRARALGTRFSVRRLKDAGATRVTVHESRVELGPAAAAADCRRLRGGEQAEATEVRFGPVVAVTTGMEPAWVRGLLEVGNRPVVDVLDELARYHRGLLRYDAEALASLQVSGVLPLDETGRALNALAATLPLRIEHRTPWVATVTLKRP